MDLQINNLFVNYSTTEVIKNLSIKVQDGDFFTILGQSGSGKSTILKTIAGLHESQSGDLLLDGKSISPIPSEQRQIAYIFQKPLLFPHLNVYDNIAFGPDVHGWQKDKTKGQIEHLIKLVKIEGLENRMPSQLSGGQQQRVAIARALVLNHKLLLMDEPFSNLDPSLREEMGQLVKDLQSELKLTIIFVTHDVVEALTLSNKISYLTKGQILQSGTPSDMYNYPNTKELAEFMGKTNWVRGKVKQHNFTSILGNSSTQLEDTNTAYQLLRPHDLSIQKNGTDFTIKSSQRTGQETTTTLIKDKVILTVTELKDQLYEEGTTVGVSILNNYCHILKA